MKKSLALHLSTKKDRMIPNHQRQLKTLTSSETLRGICITSITKNNPYLPIVSPIYLLFHCLPPLKALAPFSLSCHFSTNLLFFIKMLDKLQVLTTPLSYSSLRCLPCVSMTHVNKVFIFYC